MEVIGDFIGRDNVEKLLSILDLSFPMSEMTGVGAVAGAIASPDGGPWVNDKEIEDGNEDEKQKSKLETRENNDLVTVDEVMRLIMERGIMR
jgi:hypothetical protein